MIYTNSTSHYNLHKSLENYTKTVEVNCISYRFVVYLQITHTKQKFSIAKQVNTIEAIIDSLRNDSRLFQCSIHSVSLSRTCLSISKNRSMKTFQCLVYNVMYIGFVYVLICTVCKSVNAIDGTRYMLLQMYNSIISYTPTD